MRKDYTDVPTVAEMRARAKAAQVQISDKSYMARVRDALDGVKRAEHEATQALHARIANLEEQIRLMEVDHQHEISCIRREHEQEMAEAERRGRESMKNDTTNRLLSIRR